MEAAQGNVDDALACYSQAYEAFSAANNVYEAGRCKAAMAHLLAMRDPADSERPTFSSPPIFPNVKMLSNV